MAGNRDLEAGPPGNRWRLAVWGTAMGLFLIPTVAKLVTSEMAWTGSDFLTMAAMLATACGLYELATRMIASIAYRAGFGFAVVAAFLLVWINLAVGMIGSEQDRANLVFAGVLAVGVIGAGFARLQPAGMARTLLAMAIAQALAGAFALVLGSMEGTLLSFFFAAMWILSAELFRRAAQDQGLFGQG
jgi:hypothetical protein